MPCLAVHLTLATAIAASQSDELARKALAIAEKHRDAILSVKVVLKQAISFGGRVMQENEQKLEVNGTNLDASGLVVVSYSSVNPGDRMSSMMAGMGGGGGESKVDFKTSLQDVKIALNDGKEIPAEVAFSDKDLDIALVRPKETKDLALPFLELASAPEPSLLDRFVSISRSDRGTGRAPLVNLGRVAGIVKKPRLYYLANDSFTGCPAFDLSGRLLGVLLHRPTSSSGSSHISAFSLDESLLASMMPSILPTGDLQEAVRQLRESKK